MRRRRRRHGGLLLEARNPRTKNRNPKRRFPPCCLRGCVRATEESRKSPNVLSDFTILDVDICVRLDFAPKMERNPSPLGIIYPVAVEACLVFQNTPYACGRSRKGVEGGVGGLTFGGVDFEQKKERKPSPPRERAPDLPRKPAGHGAAKADAMVVEVLVATRHSRSALHFNFGAGNSPGEENWKV